MRGCGDAELLMSSRASADPERAQRDEGSSVASRDLQTHRALCNDGTRIVNGDHAEKAGFVWSTARPRILSDLPEESGLLRGGGEIFPPHPVKNFEVVDGYDGCACAWSTTPRGVDPAFSGKSGLIRVCRLRGREEDPAVSAESPSKIRVPSFGLRETRARRANQAILAIRSPASEISEPPHLRPCDASLP